MHWLRRFWSMLSQPGTGGLIQHGDWRCVYPDGTRTYWMSHGDAANCRQMWGGKVEWRGDANVRQRTRRKEMDVHVICCNDSVEFAVIENEDKAKNKMAELSAAH